MFHHNSRLVARAGDALLARTSKPVVDEQEMSGGQDEVYYNRGEADIREARMETSDDGNSAEGSVEEEDETTAHHVIMYRGSFEGEENPVWMYMCHMRRYQSPVESIPGMEKEEFRCKKIQNEEPDEGESD